MRRPDARVSIKSGVPDVTVYRSNMIVELRNYDTRGLDPASLWADMYGKRCARTFITYLDIPDKGLPDDLTRFVDDLSKRAGLQATLRLSDELPGMHSIRLRNVEFFFNPDGSYDGCDAYVDDADRSD